MIGYATLGTNDLAKASAFYEQLLAEIGGKKIMSNERMTMFAAGQNQPMLAVCKPFDGKSASAGNGTMLALSAPSQEAVQKLHARALALGGRDEGAPGPRGPGGYFAYFRDLDGNKIAAFARG
jgi:catechol 2,3-dioxygenase-like lactoylglutathione lyase family enzyme